MHRQNKKILHEISKLEALLRFKRIRNAKQKKSKENDNFLLQYNSDVFYAVEDYKSLKENMLNAVLSFLQPRLTYQYAKIRIESE